MVMPAATQFQTRGSSFAHLGEGGEHVLAEVVAAEGDLPRLGRELPSALQPHLNVLPHCQQLPSVQLRRLLPNHRF